MFNQKFAYIYFASLLALTSCDAESSAKLESIKEYSLDMINCNQETNTCSEKETNEPITGIVKEYYDNSHKRIKSEITYKDGYLNGSEKLYYIDGKMKSEANFVNGERDGIVKEYHSNGQLKEEATFKNGAPDGIVKDYYKNGQLKAEATIKNGYFDGIRKEYYEDGKLSFEGKYKGGNTINEINYAQDGTKISETVFSDISGLVNEGYKIEYNSDGSIKSKEEILVARKDNVKSQKPSNNIVQKNNNVVNQSSGICSNYNYCLELKDEYERIASSTYCPMIKNEGTPLAQLMYGEYAKVESEYWNKINQECPSSNCNQNDFNLDPFRFCSF